jgi:hypothetical protein
LSKRNNDNDIVVDGEGDDDDNNNNNNNKVKIKVKVKLTLEQATKALDGGGWTTPRPGRFTTKEDTRYPVYKRLGGPQSQSGRVRTILHPVGFDPLTVKAVVSCYTDRAIPAHDDDDDDDDDNNNKYVASENHTFSESAELL